MTIESTLARFGLRMHVVEVNEGPVFTEYVFTAADARANRNLARVGDLLPDLTMDLGADQPVELQHSLSQPGYLAFQVKNRWRQAVRLGHVTEYADREVDTAHLPLLLGKRVNGWSVIDDLRSLGNILVCGRTGSGKSTLLDAILASLLLYNTPKQLMLSLADPTGTEFAVYADLPHAIHGVVTDAQTLIGMLTWLMEEAETRLQRLHQHGVRNIDQIALHDREFLPYIVVFVHGLTHFLTDADRRLQPLLLRIGKVAGAVGIHLVADVGSPIPPGFLDTYGMIFQTRFCLRVADRKESEAVLGCEGGEGLLGQGDMLFRKAVDRATPLRVQCTYVSEGELLRITDYWRSVAATCPEEAQKGEI
jgi:DNA segregation ATPase FtsK/SpoIIIE, S-DNA-T family